MTELAIQIDKLPTQFKPEQAYEKQIQLDAIIALAAKTKNLDALGEAVETKINELREFLEWWGNRVNNGRPNKTISDGEIVFSAEKATELTGFTPVQVTRIKKNLKDEARYKEKILIAAWKKAFPNDPLITQHTGDVEWHTPPEYIEKARAVMGNIDTDPASNEIANETVKAETFYTMNNSGLDQKWLGSVWMNPPYGAREIRQFAEKLVSEYECGNATQAIAVTNSSTDTGWFNTLAKGASIICLTTGRISFHKPDGERTSPTMGQAFFYFGNNRESFIEHFSDVGLLIELVRS